MENENEEKKVDTQTTGNDTQNSNNNDSQVNAIFGNQDENNQKKPNNGNTEEKNDKSGNETEENDVSNQNKNEDEKSKKTNFVEKKTEDHAINFRSQEELDGFIARKYAQGAKKATQGETSKQKEEQAKETPEGSEEDKTKEEIQVQNQQNTLPNDYYQNKIGLAMAVKGINPTKLQRASRLVDQDKVIVNGTVDEAKLEEEINAIITEFPELVGTNNASEQKGFKFGAAGNQTQDATSNINDEIDSIFGNK